MAKDRAKDDRRSVGSHQKMTAALGKAAGWSSRKAAMPTNTVSRLATHSTEGGQPNTPVKRMHKAFLPGQGNIDVTTSQLPSNFQGAKGISTNYKASDVNAMVRGK